MSVEYRSAAVPASDLRSKARTAGITGVVSTKAMDLAVTLGVLLAHPGAEWNPVAAALYAHLGWAGLVAVAIAVVGVTIAVVEIGADWLHGRDPTLAMAVRIGGYLPLSLLWLAVAVHNIHQLAGVVA